jgi:hypothetical protein
MCSHDAARPYNFIYRLKYDRTTFVDYDVEFVVKEVVEKKLVFQKVFIVQVFSIRFQNVGGQSLWYLRTLNQTPESDFYQEFENLDKFLNEEIMKNLSSEPVDLTVYRNLIAACREFGEEYHGLSFLIKGCQQC